METPVLVILFSFGAILGSFFNVVIYRLPKQESIVYGSSHCPKCMTPIKAYDLIPILSYMFLKGQCRQCKATISLRYPMIEGITALSFTLVYLRYGFTYFTLIGILLASILIIVTMIDIDTLEIYDRFQIMILALAFGMLLISPLPILDHLIGFFIISIPFYIIAYLTGGIGGGDIKMMAVAGLLLGFQATLVAFFIASILGGSIALYLVVTKQKERKSLIAFGPYLCIGIYFAYLFGNDLWNWYLHLFV